MLMHDVACVSVRGLDHVTNCGLSHIMYNLIVISSSSSCGRLRDINTNIIDSVMGKVEGQGESWHGHVTAVTVAPEYRRQQLAKKLMNLLEDISDNM